MPWLGIGRSKFHDWINRFGKVNEHNAWVPRDHWLTDDENARICAFARAHPLEGYRRMTFMMLDADVVACSPASVYRVLKNAGLLAGQTPTVTKKGTGFVQPLQAPSSTGTSMSATSTSPAPFTSSARILDGYSRFIVHWEIREKMEEIDVETILQRAREKFPGATPRIISDNGPQFIAKDFKEFIRIAGMTHVRTSPYYPQSNGKIERWHKTLKGDCIRVQVPLSLDDARRLVADYVAHYNHVRLHSAIGYVTPQGQAPAATTKPFMPHATANWPRPANAANNCGKPGTSQIEVPVPTPSRPAIDFAAVRAAITIAQVLHAAGLRAALRPRAASNAAPVPCTARLHGTGRCFSVNLDAHTFHCFKCGRSGNALDLWAQANRLTHLRCRHRPVPAPEHPAANCCHRRQPRTEKRNP